MTVHCLQQKRFAAAKNKVHIELVHYYVNLEQERRLWYFSTSIRSYACEHYFTVSQAEQLVGKLSSYYGIRKANIETAVAFLSHGHFKTKGNKVFRFRDEYMSSEHFEEQLFVLDHLVQEHLLEYRQALDLVLNILDNYPAARRVFA